MGQRKETPKKVYRKTFANTECICRLCCGVYDPKHKKNIYHKANVKLLVIVETVFGNKLPNQSKPFKNMVCENQTSMMKKKRCLNISPSAPIKEGKRAKTNIGEKSPASCRSLSFTFDKEVTQSDVCSISQLRS